MQFSLINESDLIPCQDHNKCFACGLQKPVLSLSTANNFILVHLRRNVIPLASPSPYQPPSPFIISPHTITGYLESPCHYFSLSPAANCRDTHLNPPVTGFPQPPLPLTRASVEIPAGQLILRLGTQRACWGRGASTAGSGAMQLIIVCQ